MSIPAADYPFLDIFWSMIIFFIWVAWICTLVMIVTDVFRRDDLSGWGKAFWTLFIIILPFLGVLIYVIAHGTDMGDRRASRAEMAMVGGHQPYTNGSASPSAQIAEAKALLDTGAIDPDEFAKLKARALA